MSSKWFQNKLSDLTSEQKARLDAHVELKNENLLTSSEAILDQRLRDQEDAMLEQVKANTGIQPDVPPYFVAKASSGFTRFMEGLLELSASRLGTDKDYGFTSKHNALSELDTKYKYITESRSREEQAEHKYGHFTWKVDTQHFIEFVFESLGEDTKEASSLDLKELAIEYTKANSSTPILTAIHSNEQISLNDFLSEVRHRAPIPELKEFHMDLERSSYEFEEVSEEEIIQNLKYENIEHANRNINSAFDGMELQVSEYISTVLYNVDALYRRAERDMTLGQLWVQRRVALALVYKQQEVCSYTEEEAAELIDDISSQITRRISRLTEMENQLKQPEAARVLLHDSISASNQERLNEARYYRQALIENRVFLVRFFSS